MKIFNWLTFSREQNDAQDHCLAAMVWLCTAGMLWCFYMAVSTYV
jgi:hypothetical protein